MLLVKVFSTTRPSVSISKMADTEALEEIGFPVVKRSILVRSFEAGDNQFIAYRVVFLTGPPKK